MTENNFAGKPFNLSDADARWVEETWAGMSEDEKIGQLFFMVGYRRDEEFLRHVAHDLHIGGLMCRCMPSEDVIGTVSVLQTNARIPFLIAANLEAGGNGVTPAGTKVGSQMAAAATGDVESAYLLGKVCAREAKSVGVNFAFAPVCDIDLNFRNPITNTRTYGADSDTVLAMAKAYMRACDEHGICTSAKHFPGDGVDERDQHLLSSVNSLSCEEWDESYGKIYKGMIDAGVKAVMVGHIMQPAWSRRLCPELAEEDIMPASLSKELLQGLLRERLGFQGLIITDATTMAGFAAAMPRSEAVPGAIAAGCDMFLFTKNLDEDLRFMRQGVRSGMITPERLEAAVKHVLALKASLGLHRQENLPNAAQAEKILSCTEHKAIAQKIADESITLVKEEKGVLPISPTRHKRVLAYDIEGGANPLGYNRTLGVTAQLIALLEKEGFEVERFVPGGVYEGTQSSFEEMCSRYDLMLYVCNLGTKSNQTTVRIEWMNPMGINVPVYMKSIPTIFVSLENPYHLLDVPRVRTYINTYGVNDYTLPLLVDKLMGRSDFRGVSPVDPFCGKWDAKLTR